MFDWPNVEAMDLSSIGLFGKSTTNSVANSSHVMESVHTFNTQNLRENSTLIPERNISRNNIHNFKIAILLVGEV